MTGFWVVPVVAIACVKLFRSLMSYPELLVNANETVTLTGSPTTAAAGTSTSKEEGPA